MEVHFSPPSSFRRNVEQPSTNKLPYAVGRNSCSSPRSKRDFPLFKTPFYFKNFHGSKARWRKQAHFGSLQSESISRGPIFLPSLYQEPQRIAFPSELGSQDRFERCLLACTDKLKLSNLSGFPVGSRILSVQSSSFRPLPGSCNLPGTDEFPSSELQGERNSLSCLPGRLDNLGRDERKMQGEYPCYPRNSFQDRFQDKLEEISTRSFPTYHLARSRMGFKKTLDFYPSLKKKRDFLYSSGNSGSRLGYESNLGEVHGSSDLCRVRKPSSQSDEETDGPNPPSNSQFSNCDGSALDDSTSSRMVEQRGKSEHPFLFRISSSRNLPVDRCLRVRLGSSRPVWKLGSRRLGPLFHPSSHELERIKSSKFESIIPAGQNRLINSVVLGQQYNSSVPEKTGLDKIHFSYSSSSGEYGDLQPEKPAATAPQGSWQTQRSGRCSFQEHNSQWRVANSGPGQVDAEINVSTTSGRPYGYPVQCNSGQIYLPISASSSDSDRCLVSGLESVERSVHLSTPSSSSTSLEEFRIVPGQDVSGPENAPVVATQVSTQSVSSVVSSNSTPPSVSEGRVGGRLQAQLLSMDRLSFLRAILSPKYGETVTNKLLASKRASTRRQQEVAWNALKEWLSGQELEELSNGNILEFLIWLREHKNLATTTIQNYNASLKLPLRMAFDIDCSSWEFRELKSAFFLERPPNPPKIPMWDMNSVLDLLKSPKYSAHPPDLYFLLKKCVFLIALASGNRVSELGAMYRTGLDNVNISEKVTIPIMPGFLYKNQRLGRTPPNIEIVPLSDGPRALCPVENLASYLSLSGPCRGPLFLNSQTKVPLHKSTISKILCEVIEEASPNCMPRAHEVRKFATSLAWTRGLSPEEITKRAFWRSSSIFIDRYLSSKVSQNCVALNTC